MATFELYRVSSIGKALTETLNEMVEGNILSPDLAIQVLLSFDKSIAEFLGRQVRPKITFKGHLHTYRICCDVCTFIVQDAQITTDEGLQSVDWLKIVACDSNLLRRRHRDQQEKEKIVVVGQTHLRELNSSTSNSIHGFRNCIVSGE